jgi:hypothetical protein
MPTRREAITALAALAWQRPATPGTRAGHALAYHAGLNALCMVGGDAPADENLETWFWNGTAWTRRTLKDRPIVTTLVAAVSDVAQKSVLTFGGITVLGKRYGPPSGDLWELTANGTWRKRASGDAQPGARHHHAAAFDSARGRLVLYGGIDEYDKWTTDVWEWDRTLWHRIETATGPGERAHHAMAYDSRRRRIVLRGGTRSTKERPNDTWEWDGTAWHQVATDGPDPGRGYRMAYDSEHGVTVLFGGNTCLWDGKQWTRAETPVAPPPRSVHALAYDPVRKRVVLYGGSIDPGNGDDTWEWDGARWTAMQPR